MQENRAWERNAQRLVALLVPDQVDDVLIEKGFKIGAPRQTELAQRLLTNGNGLADPLLWLCALRSSFFGRLSLGFGDVQGHCQLVQLPRLQTWGQQAHPDRKSTRLNSSHQCANRLPSFACKKKT